MYWSPAQMLAHLTVNGASLRTGDLFASGHGERRRPRTRSAACSRSPGTASSRSTLADGSDARLPRGRRHGDAARDRARLRTAAS